MFSNYFLTNLLALPPPTTLDQNPMTKKRKAQEQLDNLFLSAKKAKLGGKSELLLYKELAEIPFSVDPLQWWKQNATTYPTIATLAKQYLAVPSSQAITERSFSTGRRIVAERFALKPCNVSNLVVWHQCSAIFEKTAKYNN